MRLGDGGFISTVDTVVALQALVLYSYHSRIKVNISFVMLDSIVFYLSSNYLSNICYPCNSGSPFLKIR